MARNDALKAIARDIPDPAEYAYYLDATIVDALLTARRRGFWCVSREAAEILRPHGLCEYGGAGLTVFAIKVVAELRRLGA